MPVEIYLENHPAKLCGQQKLLAFPYQRIDNKVVSHICNSGAKLVRAGGIIKMIFDKEGHKL